ncbi:MAG: DEAD/DEAH box helicase, partial [Erysipelotrichaceae bacterium]
LEFWLHDKVVLYANEESLRVEAIAASPEIHALRLDTMARLLDKEVLVCVTHVGALIRYLPEVNQFKQHIIQLELHQIHKPKELLIKLKNIGYIEVVKIDQPLQVAQRGGIIDIFPVNYEDPVRIEFYDTEIEGIRFFDLSTQRSKGICEKATILPASEILFTDADIELIETKTNLKLSSLKDNEHYIELEEHIHYDLDLMRNHLNENHLYRYRHLLDTNNTILDYMNNPLLILSSYEDVVEHTKTLNEETLDYLVEIYQNHKALPYFEVFSDLTKSLTPYRRNDLHRFESRQSFQLPFREMDMPALSLAQHINQIQDELDNRIQILCLKEPEIKQIIPMLVDKHIPYTLRLTELKAGRIIIMNTHLDEGFILLNQNIWVYSSKELFKQKIHIGRYYSKFKDAETLHNYQDLQAGDYVVHHQHGVGKYIGIITKEQDGIHKDYLHIVYKNDSVLYVPLEQFQLVRKFVSKEGVVPKLHSLGSLEWIKTKARIKESVKDIAQHLIALYALRENEIAHAFGEDSEMQKEFESEFEYQLTHDQAVAIEEVKTDMMSKKPMDRLLCGDVGFGKTEVAIRAAFKAVSEMKQVAYLCPTTVLANQHYHTFIERFKNYPVNIALLNRYVPENHQKSIIASLKDQKVDILIGTHRILSKDIHFKDLGLLIIDEEQRFGVEHKEKIKEVKQAVHVLSLSATPIPRTLQMSLIGIRALSQLESPPLNRLPILTYVVEKNKHLIKEVIQRELARKGQVFYLYNQVENIH